MKRLIILLLSAVLVGVFHLLILFSAWGSRLESWILDVWFNLRGAVEAPSDVVVISMDESSYSLLGVPMDRAWPRALHAQLLRRLHDYKVQRVVMDILFLNQTNEADDSALSEAIGMNPTVLACDSGIREQATSAGRFTMEELLEPVEIFSSKAESLALARMPDDFGFVRRFIVPRTNATKHLASLYEAALGKDRPSNKPTDRDFLWYYGPPGAITTFAYHQVLNEKGSLPPEALKDKIVYVGLNLRTELGPSQKDTYRTPFYDLGSMFGVEIQATATANLIQQKWLHRGSFTLEAILLFIISVALCALLFHLKPHWAGIVMVSAIGVWLVASYLAFLGGYFLPGFILIALVLPVSYLASTLVYYLLTSRSQQAVEKAFQMYLSPEMAKQMRDNPGGLSLGGESLYATALFTDIEGFTSITEGMLASEVSEMLNSYFTEVMDVIFEKKGTLIKFIGDAVFALWGAPIKIPDHARMCCETALAIQKGVVEFNAKKRFPALNTRVGINTGPMVVGNLGSARRFDYTAIGDSVNLAARLEGLNKLFGTDILISDSVKKELGANFQTLQLGDICVVGKREATTVHALLSAAPPGEAVSFWQKGLARFRLRDWDEAEKLFEQAAALEKRLQKARELYLKEIKRHRESAPDDNWQGEIEVSSK